MKVVSIEVAKKLARSKLNQGQTVKMYQKQNNCSIYDIKDNHKNAFCAYDAPNKNELIKIVGAMRLTSHFIGITDTEIYAVMLIALLKYNKTTLENIRI